MLRPSPAHCVECLGPLVLVVYGLPTPDAFNDENFYSGGCTVEIGPSEMYFCRACDCELTAVEVLFI